MLYLLAFPIAYLVGAVPTGYWLCKALFGADITQQGSGNIGASNVGRTYGKRYFVLIFLLDAFKAYVVLAGAYFLALLKQFLALFQHCMCWHCACCLATPILFF